MIQPALADDAFLADVDAARQEAGALHLWWLGQSGFLVQWQGRHLLLDPYLSDSLTHKYAGTDKPHVRMTARVVAPERLDFIDLVTSSHNHTDHLDAETLTPLLAANPGLPIVVAAANRTFAAARLGLDLARLVAVDPDRGPTAVDAAGFRVHAVPAAHEALDQDEAGRCRFVGYMVECGPWTIYHSGDTVWYGGMVDRLRRWSVDLALLPINGRKPERRVAGNLDGAEAAALAHAMGARCVIPCHYEMFEFNTATPDDFVAAAQRLDQPYHLLRAGERFTLRR